jgi:hypothetical protein
MSAIKATAYTFPIILALTIPSFAAYHGGGHIGGFRGAEPSMLEALTMASEAGAVVSSLTARGGFAGRMNTRSVSARFTISRVK